MSYWHCEPLIFRWLPATMHFFWCQLHTQGPNKSRDMSLARGGMILVASKADNSSSHVDGEVTLTASDIPGEDLKEPLLLKMPRANSACYWTLNQRLKVQPVLSCIWFSRKPVKLCSRVCFGYDHRHNTSVQGYFCFCMLIASFNHCNSASAWALHMQLASKEAEFITTTASVPLNKY